MNDFLPMHPVFTVQELDQFLEKRGKRSPQRKNFLRHCLKKGQILSIRPGVFAAVPRGRDAQSCSADPYQVASRLTDDAVIAYHAALAFYGKAYSVSQLFQYLSRLQPRVLHFRDLLFQRVQFPVALKTPRQKFFEVKSFDRDGLKVRVTSLERTVVDVLDRPTHGGGLAEVWQSLGKVESLDLDKVARYALSLDTATTIAKVGHFLEQHKDTLMVSESLLETLRKRRPKSQHYMIRGSRGGWLVPRWNLVVPEEALSRSWLELNKGKGSYWRHRR